MSTQDRYVEAVNRQDSMAAADLLHDDYVDPPEWRRDGVELADSSA